MYKNETNQLFKNAYKKIGAPFQTLANQFQKFSQTIDKNFYDRKKIQKEIYNKINKLLEPLRVEWGDDDYLNLKANNLLELDKLKELIDSDETKNYIESIKSIDNIDDEFIELMIFEYLILYVGRRPLSTSTEEFPQLTIIDNSVELENNNNTNNNTNNTNNTNNMNNKNKQVTYPEREEYTTNANYENAVKEYLERRYKEYELRQREENENNNNNNNNNNSVSEVTNINKLNISKQRAGSNKRRTIKKIKKHTIIRNASRGRRRF
jgi:hypothetical protein